MSRFIKLYLPALLLVVVSLVLVFSPKTQMIVDSAVSSAGAWSYFVYVLILVGAVVFMPVTVMPIIPMASASLGPLIIALLSIVGWTIGAVIAFLIARHVGRPIVEKWVSLERVDTFIAKATPRSKFLIIVLLRLTIPVDVASYALGLTRTIGFLEYTLATFVGVIWFSFAFAYMGDALFSGNTPLLIELAGASLVIFTVGWYLLRK